MLLMPLYQQRQQSKVCSHKKERKENYKVDQPLAINILKFVGAILLYIVFSPFIIVSVIYKGIIISRDEIEGSISRLEKASGTKVSA